MVPVSIMRRSVDSPSKILCFFHMLIYYDPYSCKDYRTHVYVYNISAHISICMHRYRGPPLITPIQILHQISFTPRTIYKFREYVSTLKYITYYVYTYYTYVPYTYTRKYILILHYTILVYTYFYSFILYLHIHTYTILY